MLTTFNNSFWDSESQKPVTELITISEYMDEQDFAISAVGLFQSMLFHGLRIIV